MQLIESRVKDMLQATRLAQAKATRESQLKYLEGQVTAFKRVLKEIAEIQEDWDSSLLETVGEANLRFIQWSRGSWIPR
jgi:hypothetical protein